MLCTTVTERNGVCRENVNREYKVEFEVDDRTSHRPAHVCDWTQSCSVARSTFYYHQDKSAENPTYRGHSEITRFNFGCHTTKLKYIFIGKIEKDISNRFLALQTFIFKGRLRELRLYSEKKNGNLRDNTEGDTVRKWREDRDEEDKQ